MTGFLRIAIILYCGDFRVFLRTYVHPYRVSVRLYVCTQISGEKLIYAFLLIMAGRNLRFDELKDVQDIPPNK